MTPAPIVGVADSLETRLLDAARHVEGLNDQTAALMREAAKAITPDAAAIAALDRASELFHEILSAINAKRILADLPASPSNPAQTWLRTELEKNLRDDKVIARLAADGFELCVRQLHAMGVPDITITSCNPSEEPPSDGKE